MQTSLKFLASIFFIHFLLSCVQVDKKEQSNILIETPKIPDSSIYAILTFDTTDTWLFKKAKPTTLAEIEIEQIDSLVKICVEQYNTRQQFEFDSLPKTHPQKKYPPHLMLPIAQYKRQYFPVINSSGQKEVWVNCFCVSNRKNWKKEKVYIQDGGNCFFNLKINLSTKTYYEFSINSYG